jgi:bisanhydrobacterioruberin hydratase
MERKAFIKSYGKYAFIYVIFLVGIIGHLIDKTHDVMLWLTPYTLLLMGMYVFYHTVKYSGYSIFIWSAATYIITFALESIGVYTGLIFGSYVYGETLGFSVLGVPLVIAYNWVLVILGAASLAYRFTHIPFLFSLTTAILAVLFDIVLEPVAVSLDYWLWLEGKVPLQNYFAWFVIAFFASFSLIKAKIKFRSSTAVHYLMAQMIFFLTILSILDKN